MLFSSTSFVCRPPVSLERGKRDFIFFAQRGEYAAWPKVSALLAGGIMFAVSAELTVVLPLMGFSVLVAMGQGWFQPESTARIKDVVRYTAMYTVVSRPPASQSNGSRGHHGRPGGSKPMLSFHRSCGPSWEGRSYTTP